ncbi:MAG: peptidyl-prolyl cis-trans isomerase [Flavobacteriaceae bacterium]|nr:peptidyl-prolyl cis-trans isomerase [Flavobacteriaceae bacterium]MBT4297171.1 peptidyl-prolyl cis-trans isomerase [Flavobacteriaceae bacterium]MBT4960981.1 peptidyl-prolyl cis-trans isomerase [Flavobacteriaceae bacterium]MBT5493288.1 peptidyl-prolyl cis-trans isomerase [Flavobacteriaceae bacterium]MBT7573828.1 peptidyl-prolyl cis-trans isomerase [Flavobacteriaceae bacterium]
MKVYIFFLLFIGCDFIENKPDQVLARLGDEFYYKSDLIEIFPTGISEEDSVIFVKNRINNWAKEKLLFKKALVNLGDKKQGDLNQLIESYKNELFSYAYQEKIVKSAMDTFISEQSVREYYNINKLNFKLNQEIINARYLKINSENYNLKDVVKRFKRFKQSDKIFLDSISLQFSSYYFNDSLWINKDVFFNKLPDINDRLKQNIVKNKLFYRLEDSLELYLINIKNYKLKNDIAPFDFIKSTLKQVLLNKKKLEFISKFENEIIEDALQQNEFEFYETN